MPVEEECIQVVSRELEEVTLNCDSTSPTYEMAFSENNPSITWKDRTSDSSDLKEVFSKFDSSAPISTEILSRARFLCAKYLGGAWRRVQLDQIVLKAITGGTSNLLFLVELSNSVPLSGVEPSRALLRIQCQTDLEQLLSESVVFTLLSERVLGPKLLGVFPGGRFEQFIPSRALQCEEISKPMIARFIAPMLARVHTLDVPITKEPGLILCARGYLNKFRTTAGGAKPINIQCTAAKVSYDQVPSSISCNDLEKELDFVEDFLIKSKSPVVFSHNDLQEGNILLIDDYIINDEGNVMCKSGSSDTSEPFVLIDFEYCNYNYRGFDLGNHFCEYGYDYNCDEPPYYKIHQEKFNVTEERKIFCEAYLDEVYKMRDSHENPHFPSDLVTGDHDKDLATLISESIHFMPVSNLFWACWGLLNAESD